MQQPRILIEPRYSVERRALRRDAAELAAQSAYLLIHLPAGASDLPARATVLANPNQSLRVSREGRGEALLVRFAPQLLVEAAARIRLHPTGANILFRQPLVPLTDDERLHATLSAIQDELSEGAEGWREVIGSLINQLVVYLLRSHVNVHRSEEVELSRVGLVDRRLRRAIEFMHDNCGRELALSEIAETAYLSPFHFARLFKKITGATPHSYLAALRVERARRLLAETDLTLSEVGARVGYESQSHFTKVFREATGLTPRAFREAARHS
jgi:AraC family transcriptional regulator